VVVDADVFLFDAGVQDARFEGLLDRGAWQEGPDVAFDATTSRFTNCLKAGGSF